jgi:hypothetical protein
MSEDRIREALSRRDGASSSAECPDAGVLWDLATGTLDAGRARSVGLHAVGCGACREALRLAREAGAAGTAAPRASSRAWTRWAAAAAAVAILAIVAVMRDAPIAPPPASEYREEPAVSIAAERPQAVVAAGEPVVLRWTEIPGARYDLTVARESLEVLSVARGLDRPEWEVPSATVADLSPGQSLLWQVEAVLPEGRRVRSATFSVRRE